MTRERWFLSDEATAMLDWQRSARDAGVPTEVARALYAQVIRLSDDIRHIEELYARALHAAAAAARRPAVPTPVPGRQTLVLHDPSNRAAWQLAELAQLGPGKWTRALIEDTSGEVRLPGHEDLQQTMGIPLAPSVLLDLTEGAVGSARSHPHRAAVWATQELGSERAHPIHADIFGPGRRLAFQGPVARAPQQLPPAGAIALARARGLAELVEVLSTRTGDPHGEVGRAALASADSHVAVMAWGLLSAVARNASGPPSRVSTTARGKGPALAAAADRRAATILRREREGEPNLDAPEVEEALRRMGAGQPLPQALRVDLEARLQHPLSRVRIHTDEVAANAADAVRARAFTIGEDVFFARGAFDPTSQEGRDLLLHELTHVVQDYEGRVPREIARRVSQPHEALEREAQQVARSGGRPAAGGGRVATSDRPGHIRAATPRAPGAIGTDGVILRDPPPAQASEDSPDPANESALQALLTRTGITPPRLRSTLAPADAQRVIDLLTAARATPTVYGPRMVALYLMRGVQSSGGSTLASVVQRMRQFGPIVIVRPDGYISWALSGHAIQRAGRLQSGPEGLRAGGYEIGRFYYNNGGVFYDVSPSLQRTGVPVGELGLEGGLGPIDAVLDGVEDALRGMVEGIVRLITHPIQSIQDLANLPGAIRALIANSPEYWELFRAKPLNDQIRDISRITTTVVLTYGSAAGMTTRISAAAGELGNITINTLRITRDGQLAMATVAVPVGQMATALSGAPGGIYILHMANSSSEGSSGGGSSGGGGGRAFTEQDVQTLISDTNKEAPLTRANAEQALTGPPGTRVRVAGPGGAGADVEFLDSAGQAVLRREVKAINGGVNSFNTDVSHAATQLAGRGEIWTQVPAGTDVNAWLRAFRGRRNAAALARYQGVQLRAFDPAGTILYDGPIVP